MDTVSTHQTSPDQATPAQASPVQLLWTSGWDSTFQLLRLLLEHRVPVQPTYALDATRASAPVELKAMDSIRTALA